MSGPIVGVIGIVVMILMFATGMRVAYVMFFLGFLGFCYLASVQGSISILGTAIFQQVSNEALLVIPLFMLMGELSTHSELTKDAFEMGQRWFGHLRGGLAIGTTWACAALGAVIGSGMASAATMATVAIPEMKRQGYDAKYASAVVASSSCLAVLIPPSVPLIIYASLTNESVAKLFIGVIPCGLLMAVLFSITDYVVVRFRPSLAPVTPRATFKERLAVLPKGGPIAVIFIVAIGGIYAGIFTPNEAAAVGTVAVLILGIVRKTVNGQRLMLACRQSVANAAMVMLLLAGALVYSRFLTVTKLTFVLADAAATIPPSLAMIGIIVTFLVLGMVIEVLPLLMITVPIVFPLVVALGYDPIWFGIITTILMNVGGLSPPVAMIVYVVSNLGGVPINDIFKHIWPFMIAQITCIAILLIFSQIATFLPALMKM